MNEENKLAIREALQRHPDVFLELIKNLQSEAKDNKITEDPEEIVEEEIPVVSMVIFL